VVALREIIRQQVRGKYVAIIFDEWSRFGRGFLGVMVATDTMIALLELAAPHELSMNGRAIIGTVWRVLEEYGITREQVVAAVTDCAPVMKRGLREAKIPAVSCNAHVVVKAFEYALKSDETAPLLSLAARAEMLHHNHRFGTFLQECPQLGLCNIKPFSEIRWNDMSSRPRSQGSRICEASTGSRPMGRITFRCLPRSLISTDVRRFRWSRCEVRLQPLRKRSIPTRNDEIFRALLLVVEVAEDVSAALVDAGFPEAGVELKRQVYSREVKFPESLMIIAKAALLNPNLVVPQILEVVPPEFAAIVTMAEEELVAACQIMPQDAHAIAP
jgi:hypothetical protein